ncbi:MAG: hypothetical protein EBR34_16275 [Sphingomonadaceae bacterium]|nr:hypothetical protein [Sphingomonadaceae bacterium]
MGAIIGDLTGSGMPVQLAALVGFRPAATIAGAGTAQKTDSAAVTAANLLPTQGLVNATTASSQTALQIPSTMPLGACIVLNVTSSTTALLFPPDAGTINGGSANASVNVAQNKPTLIFRLTSTIFVAVIGA